LHTIVFRLHASVLFQKSTIVFHAENMHVHSRRKIRSFFFMTTNQKPSYIIIFISLNRNTLQPSILRECVLHQSKATHLSSCFSDNVHELEHVQVSPVLEVRIEASKKMELYGKVPRKWSKNEKDLPISERIKAIVYWACLKLEYSISLVHFSRVLRAHVQFIVCFQNFGFVRWAF
jgi:hypothetical protein